MRYQLILLAVFSGAAMAQDSAFEREFSKFDKDFERLNSWKAETPASKKLKRAPVSTTQQPISHDGATTPLDAEQPVVDAVQKPVEIPEPAEAVGRHMPEHSSALPKGAKVEKLAHSDRLGNQISDPVMRKKVQALYKRPDVVVQQYVLPTN